MSKKKNTLKDLDEFLKQQAATLVEPTALREKIENNPEPVSSTGSAIVDKTIAKHVDPQEIINALQELRAKEGSAFRMKFYDIIIQAIGNQESFTPEDKMLINTALYLKGGDQWKAVIKNYWKDKH